MMWFFIIESQIFLAFLVQREGLSGDGTGRAGWQPDKSFWEVCMSLSTPRRSQCWNVVTWRLGASHPSLCRRRSRTGLQVPRKAYFSPEYKCSTHESIMLFTACPGLKYPKIKTQKVNLLMVNTGCCGLETKKPPALRQLCLRCKKGC